MPTNPPPMPSPREVAIEAAMPSPPASPSFHSPRHSVTIDFNPDVDLSQSTTLLPSARVDDIFPSPSASPSASLHDGATSVAPTTRSQYDTHQLGTSARSFISSSTRSTLPDKTPAWAQQGSVSIQMLDDNDVMTPEHRERLVNRYEERRRSRHRKICDLRLRHKAANSEYFSTTLPEELEGRLPNSVFRDRMVALNAGIKRCGGGLNDTTRTVLRAVGIPLSVPFLLMLVSVKFVQSYNLDERLAYGFIGGVVCWVIAVAVGVLYLLMPFKTLEFVKSELYSWDEEDANLPLRRLTWTLERKPERVSCCCSVKQSEWRIKVYQSDGGGPGDNEEFEEYLPLYNPPAAAAVVGEESVNGEAIATRVGSIRSLRSTGTVVTVSKPPSYLERQ